MDINIMSFSCKVFKGGTKKHERTTKVLLQAGLDIENIGYVLLSALVSAYE